MWFITRLNTLAREWARARAIAGLSWKDLDMRHGTKTILVILPADGKASWSLVPSSASLLSGGTVQPENI